METFTEAITDQSEIDMLCNADIDPGAGIRAGIMIINGVPHHTY